MPLYALKGTTHPSFVKGCTVPRVACILMVLYFYDHKPNNPNPLFNHNNILYKYPTGTFFYNTCITKKRYVGGCILDCFM